MQSDTQTAPISKKMLWAGYILSAIPSLFLLVDGVMKLFKLASVVKATVDLGYPESVILGLGMALIRNSSRWGPVEAGKPFSGRFEAQVGAKWGSIPEFGRPNRIPYQSRLGIVLLASLALYLIPRTTMLGAILLTGYLGGAVASHVRMEEGLFPVLFPVLVGALLWGGLYLRDARLRALLPLRS